MRLLTMCLGASVPLVAALLAMAVAADPQPEKPSSDRSPAKIAEKSPGAPAGEPIRIACVGDSISKNRHAQGGKGWPYFLGKMLGPGYDVQTFSDNGVDCLRIPSQSVWVRSNLKKAVAFKPNIVIIMLGTNVSKRGLAEHLDRYASDYRALIAFMRQSPAKPKIYLCTPIPVWEDNFGIRGEIVHDKVTPIIEKIAKDDGYPLIDTYTPLKDKKEYTSDGVHPEPPGSEALARVMYQGLLGKPAPSQSFLEDSAATQKPKTEVPTAPAKGMK